MPLDMHVFGKIVLACGVALFVALSGIGCAGPRYEGVHAGPLYRSLPDFEGNEGFQAVGPFVEHRRAPDGRRFTAIRPFWSHVSDVESRRAHTDVLWPVGSFLSRGDELHWRMLPAFGHDFDTDTSPSRHRWAVFPVLFGGRDADDQGYFAIFPLGGTIHEIFGRDRVWFVLFPLYTRSLQNDNRTTSVLWPIYSRTTGGDLYRWRVWPLYGYSHTPDRWTKRFVLWPIWTSVDYHYPGTDGGGFILFPLYGQVNLPDRQSRMLFPPFFKVEWGDTDHFAFNAPWPILQYVNSPDYERLYVFPLGGRRRRGHDRSWFALWPIFSGQRTARPREVLTRFRALPFWYYENVQTRAPAGETPDGDRLPRDEGASLSRYMRLWPLGMYRREKELSVVRVPDLWPLRQTPGIERNWAPLWTLYRRERSEDRRLSEVLWGMFRWERTPEVRDVRLFPLLESREKDDTRRWRFLYGLLGYEREDLQKTYQLLYFLRIRRGGGREGRATDEDGRGES